MIKDPAVYLEDILDSIGMIENHAFNYQNFYGTYHAFVKYLRFRIIPSGEP